jgi:hypothetical protein
MTEMILCCPYCVLDDHSRPMLTRLEGWFICAQCGHTANPGIVYNRCHCKKCLEIKRAA